MPLCESASSFKHLRYSSSILHLTDIAVNMPGCSSSDPKQSTEFPEKQRARLKSFIPDYETYIKEKNPKHQSRCSDLTKWRKDIAKRLMKEKMFIDLIGTTEAEAADWEEVHYSLSHILTSVCE